MIRSWSKSAGAPAVPAAFAVASGILAAAWLPVPPTPRLAGLLAAVCVAAVAVSFRADRRVGVLGVVVFLALAGGWRFLHGFLEPGRRTETAARSLGDDAVVAVTGRLDRLWSRSGSLFRARLAVESASAGGSLLDLPGPLHVVVAGQEDPSNVAEIGDRIRVRGPIRLPDGPPSARSPFRFPAEPRLRRASPWVWVGPRQWPHTLESR